VSTLAVAEAIGDFRGEDCPAFIANRGHDVAVGGRHGVNGSVQMRFYRLVPCAFALEARTGLRFFCCAHFLLDRRVLGVNP
jgi:hypothetical protein